MPQLTGGCLCGAVRYTTTATPLMTFVCHCRSCQRFTGSAFGAVVVVPKETVTINGTIRTFTSPGGSGMPLRRHFCPECGSSIGEEGDRAPGRVILNIGTFDEPKLVAPTFEKFCEDALPWVHLTADMQRFDKQPV
jgi:hypothetical protein